MAGCEPALLPNENGPAGDLTLLPGQPIHLLYQEE